VESLIQDVRIGLRLLAARPGFAAVAILTLALGIGANTAVFSVVNSVLLRPLPYPDADGLLRVSENRPFFRAGVNPRLGSLGQPPCVLGVPVGGWRPVAEYARARPMRARS